MIASVIPLVMTLFLIALFIMALLQPNSRRTYAAAIFAGSVIVHDSLFSAEHGALYLGYAVYYISAAFINLIATILLAGINPIPKLAIRLQQVCLISTCLNFAGFALWYNYYPPLLYDFAYILLYSYVIKELISREKIENDRIVLLGRRISYFCFDRYHLRDVFNSIAGKV